MHEETPPKKGNIKKAIRNLFSKKDKSELHGSYGKYSAIDDEKGKTKRNFSETQALKNHVNYLKNNRSDQSDNPSNIYRPENQPSTIVYDKNKNYTAG